LKENIIQLTDLPDMNIDEKKENKYIGYEHIGKHFSGYDGKVIIDDYFEKVSKIIKEEVKDGIILDLGCGDGYYAVPFVMNGIKVIAGDISNKMMILQEKLNLLKLDTSLITCARMNAYDIPIIDNSIDGVIANSMLHLNSNPNKIIDEVYRVLKPYGKFICFDDAPGKGVSENEFDNQAYLNRLNDFHQRYFELVKEQNIFPKRYSWTFDRDKVCNELFKSSYEIQLELPKTIKRTTFKEGFYKRMKGKGFSDQTAVPDEIHQLIFDKVDKEMIIKYGDNYKDAVLAAVAQYRKV
jgi:ubiquinone/menaquinone biosynthesis C-methylase UbiE